jgi:hypothetical protein
VTKGTGFGAAEVLCELMRWANDPRFALPFHLGFLPVQKVHTIRGNSRFMPGNSGLYGSAIAPLAPDFQVSV